MDIDIVDLTRDLMHTDCTLGTLIAKGQVYFTLEPPWMDNAINISCIPTGLYTCTFREKTEHHENIYVVLDVPDRTDIEMHIGNFPKDTKGCILIGMNRDFFPVHMVTNSEMALLKFNELMEKKDFLLRITNYKPIGGIV
jgi:hypothetical protein